jgi:hypothetical protein
VDGRIAVAREFEELCGQLNAHEAAENALLRRGLGADINGAALGGEPFAPA